MDAGQELDLLKRLKTRAMWAIALLGIAVAVIAALFVRNVVLNGFARIVQSGLGGFVSEAYTPADVQNASPEAAARLEELIRKRIVQGALSQVAVVRSDGTVLYRSEDDLPPMPSQATLDHALDGRIDSTLIGTGPAGTTLRVTGAVDADDGPPEAVWVGWRPYAPIAANVRMASGAVAGIVLLGAASTYLLLSIFVAQAKREIRRQQAEAETAHRRLGDALVDLESASLGTLVSLLMAIDARDRYTAMHSVHVADYAKCVAGEMGHPEAAELLERAGLLHDIGKIGTSEKVLQKPGKLDAVEFREVEAHPATGAQIIESIPFLADAVPVIRSHHERWDGTGYPDGLAGEAIPYAARVLAVADAFDAMMSTRPYRRAMGESAARAELENGRGTQFDPAVVDALLSALDGKRLKVIGPVDQAREPVVAAAS